MRSPIIHLQNQIAGAPFNVAPERACACKKYRDQNKIDFVLVDEIGFRVRVRHCAQSQTIEIVLPIASLEYLWAFSHYCWVLTQEYASAQQAGALNFDCLGNNRLSSSNNILQWARRNLADTGIDPWPSEGPRPTLDSDSGSDEHVATELFLCAIGWMLHHEIAHVVLEHPLIGTAFAQQEEREADHHATNWLLEGQHPDTPEFKKRVLGITMALLCLQSLEVNNHLCLRNTHPAAHDRIFSNLNNYQATNHEIVAAFSSVILQYLFHDTGIAANLDGHSFAEIHGELLFDISRSRNGS
jgi:hypothetical protein